MELYRKYRPSSFADVVGQREAVGVLKGWLKKGSVPHAIMFDGPSGCGKTTLARILATELGCTNELSYQEINVSVECGVVMVAELIEDSKHNITGGNRVWVLDEVHGLTSQSSNALLKVLEEAPSYAYFLLCTTNPEKILPTLLNRCQQIKVKPLSDQALRSAISRVLTAEEREIPDDVVEALVSYADGSGRKAIVKLEQCLAASRPENMLAIIQEGDQFNASVRDLCNIFTGGKKATWRETAKILGSLEDDTEKIRRAVLGWISSALVKGWARSVPPKVLADIIRIFQFNTYDSGRPGLVLMTYDAWRLLNEGRK